MSALPATFLELKPKQRAALVASAESTLRRCPGGYRRSPNDPVHTRRTVKQLERGELVVLLEDERAVAATTYGHALLNEAQPK